MIHQLRIYEIFERNKAAFHARFRDHAMRIKRVTSSEHGDLVGEIQDRVLVPASYAPKVTIA